MQHGNRDIFTWMCLPHLSSSVSSIQVRRVMLHCFCTYWQSPHEYTEGLTSISGGALLAILLQEGSQLTSIWMHPRLTWPAHHIGIFVQTIHISPQPHEPVLLHKGMQECKIRANRGSSGCIIPVSCTCYCQFPSQLTGRGAYLNSQLVRSCPVPLPTYLVRMTGSNAAKMWRGARTGMVSGSSNMQGRRVQRSRSQGEQPPSWQESQV